MSDAASGSIATDSAGFYALAQVSHWAESSLGSVPVPLSTKKPLEGRVWFNYPGQPNVDTVEVTAQGAMVQPSVTARLLDGGATQASFASYNANGFIAKSTDPIGRITNYTYDATTNIDLTQVTQTNAASSGGLDVLSTMTYPTPNPTGQTPVLYQHEPLSMTDASGQGTTLSYNAMGQMLTRTVVVNSANQTTTMAYYTNGLLHTVTGPVSGATTTYTYDTAQRAQTVTDSEGYVLTYAYDNLDRPTVTTYPDGTTDQTFYQNLDVSKTIDRQGRATTNQYDAIRELLQTIDPLGRTTKYAWCTCGGLSSLTDANGNKTMWSLDLQGRVTGKTYADTTAINYLYETNVGRLHTMTDANSNVATYSYNPDNTLAGTSYSGTNTPPVSFTYDTVYNRVTSMVDGAGTNSYSYNPVNGALGAGRLASVTVPVYGTGHTATVSYKTSAGAAGYDELGRVVSRGIDSTNYVGTTYDALGRVTNVTNMLAPASPGFKYGYVDTTSRISSVTYPSSTGLSMTNSYYGNSIGDGTGNDDQRLSEIKNMSGTNQLSDFKYTYKPVGTIATWTQQTNSTSAAVTNTISYDNADQLTQAAQSGGATNSYGYYYDPAGNRLSEKVNATTTAAGQFNSVNQLTTRLTSPGGTSVSGHTSAAITNATVNAVPATISNATNFSASVAMPGGTNVVSVVATPSSAGTPIATQRYQVVTSGGAATALTYDLNGNVLTDENGYHYAWDALNRLIKITYSSGATSNFAYDGLSRRISIIEKNSSGTVTSTKNHVWIGSEIAEERNASNTVMKRFFPQGELQSGTSYYYTRDHLGSVRELCSSMGTVASRMAYDPYGRTTTVSGTILPTKQYAGYYQHQASGLMLTPYRAYDANTGRWLSRDPIAERGGNNLYEYVGDEPIEETDPCGLANGTHPKGNGGHGSAANTYEEMSDVEDVGVIAATIGWECANGARTVAPELVPVGPEGGPQDAFRHCLWSCCMAKVLGARIAKIISDNHEKRNNTFHEQSPDDYRQDTANNANGREAAKSCSSCTDACLDKLKKGGLAGLNGQPIKYP